MKDLFSKNVSEETIQRINSLSPNSQPKWGKMDVAQMLAHCNVTYELVYENKHTKPKGFKKWMLKTFIRNIVVNEKPFKKNGRTAPEFIIKSDKDFEKEKNRLNTYITQTQKLGGEHFNGKDSHSFGELSKTEWNNMFYKHLNHHLNQFGV
jgi:hypothetical protein